jgi:hypothetical protein
LPDEVSARVQLTNRDADGIDVHAVDMLADDGKALDDSNDADYSVKQRLEYALK